MSTAIDSLVTTAELCSQAGISTATALSWMRRGVIEPEVPSSRPGEPHLFDQGTVELVKEIVAAGGIQAWEAGAELLTATEVARRSGLSFRQVDNWTRLGLITPVVDTKGTGNARFYDVSVVDEIKDLLRRIDDCPFDHGQGGSRK